ncbi:cation transporter dimerization domain-containing protein [Desulfovibrio piger]|uniref:cation transporter dimerization domain-containing protein n=1 Tax=Desulfovibrio piger TaxID=901 RepID=UPI0026EC0251|nr:cation transporter dimerization domain-containing protein [Desulfovibrio piger]
MCISFHCCVRHELSVEEAHQLTVRLEKELRERLPLLGRILIHLEPPRTESAPLGK